MASKSIKKRPNGVWRARYRDADGKEHARHFKRKIDAQSWLDEVTTSVVTGAYVDPNAGKITLASYYAEWSTRQLWETGTHRAMEYSIQSCTFKDEQLRNVRRSHVEAWIKELVANGLAPLTVHSKVQSVRSVLKGAVRDRLIHEDPSNGVVLPRKRRADAAMNIPSFAEVKALYDAAEDWFKVAVALAAFAGLRIGEVNGVQLRDIDFLRRTLSVSRQVQRESGLPVEVRAPKYGSERTVALADDLLLILSWHVENVGVYGDDGWIIPGRDNGPAWPRRMDYAWNKTATAAGVENVTMHTLRHFYASGLITNNCDVVTVQRALGHKTPSVTLDTYSHLWPSAEDRTRSAAQGLITDSLADSVRTDGTKTP